jgi:hypothetical protein
MGPNGVWAGTDRYNPYQGVGGFFGHFFGEVLGGGTLIPSNPYQPIPPSPYRQQYDALRSFLQ